MSNDQQLDEICQSAAADGILHGVVLAAGSATSQDILRSWGKAAIHPVERQMQDDAIFDIASLTKVVATATACAICMDRGLLHPNAPARDYLPGLGEWETGTIRVRDLAAHCSGLSNRKFDQDTTDDILTHLVEAPARWPVRTHFQYSCRNYILLGLIVETVTGQDLATFCEENILSPLGMHDTTFGPLADGVERVVPTILPSGIISDQQARKAPKTIGNAGLFSCVRDLARFCQMILQDGALDGQRIVGKDGLAWLTQPCSPEGLPRWSFGWDMRPCDASLHRPTALSASAIGHSGWTGHSLWIDPGQGVFVIVLTNRTHAHDPAAPDNYESSMRFRSRIADNLLAKILKSRGHV